MLSWIPFTAQQRTNCQDLLSMQTPHHACPSTENLALKYDRQVCRWQIYIEYIGESRNVNCNLDGALIQKVVLSDEPLDCC